MRWNRPLIAIAAACALLGTAAHRHSASTGSFGIDVPAGPFIAGSRLSVGATGIEGQVAFSVLGPGAMESGAFVAPNVRHKTATTLIGSARGAIALKTLVIVPPPAPGTPLLAVATYRNGVALHDPRTFALIGYASIGGAPGDVAFDRDGAIVAPDTDSDALTTIVRAPWRMRVTLGVPLGNEIAVDRDGGDVFVSNRDINGHGALTRISPDGRVTRVNTGETAEGIAIDRAHGIVYVGNVNDSSVAAVNLQTMQVIRKIGSVERTFGMALDSKTRRLFVVSNTSPSMPSRGGYAAAIDLQAKKPHIVMRSARMVFPIGAAFDESTGRLFVTDEAANAVYVLSGKTLRALRAPLKTCATPWRPRISAGRLFVPCASANQVDVFDARSLHRVAGAPFSTGGFPLSVALWP